MSFNFFIKKSIRSLEYFFQDLFLKKSIPVDYSAQQNNFGDILNPIIVEYVSGLKVKKVASKYYTKRYLMAIGSILHRANKKALVWGSGFIKENSMIHDTPNNILAVRGPKTRNRLLELGIKCPEIYGDPALLISDYYKPKIGKKYKLGIIPHYIDKKSTYLNNFTRSEDISIIDVQNSNPLLVINKILECECIASSSLHGMIVSDSYNIPNVWIKITDGITGSSFKFHDYFLTTNRDQYEPIQLNHSTTTDSLIKNSQKVNIEINLNKLKDSFPLHYFQNLN